MASNMRYPQDAPNDHGVYDDHRNEKESGLLTRWVPSKLKHSAAYRWFLRLTRLLQFLSSVISLGLFSSRVYKVYKLVNTVKRERGVSTADGAVEGILAFAVLYTIVALLMTCLLRGGGPGWLRWLWVLIDIAFVGAFIAVAALTSPDGGSAGPGNCYNSNSDVLTKVSGSGSDDSCHLPWGTFILAIISTFLHAITAAFHEVRDHRKSRKADLEQRKLAGQHHNDPHHVAR